MYDVSNPLVNTMVKVPPPTLLILIVSDLYSGLVGLRVPLTVRLPSINTLVAVMSRVVPFSSSVENLVLSLGSTNVSRLVVTVSVVTVVAESSSVKIFWACKYCQETTVATFSDNKDMMFFLFFIDYFLVLFLT